MKIITPIKSIRKYCLWCCCGSTKEVKLCPIYDCPLHPYRMGKRPNSQALLGLNSQIGKEDSKASSFLTPVKAVREKCRDCSTYRTKEIRNCKHTDCDLHPYRMGKNPNRKGIGGNSNLNPKKGCSASSNDIVDRSVI